MEFVKKDLEIFIIDNFGLKIFNHPVINKLMTPVRRRGINNSSRCSPSLKLTKNSSQIRVFKI